MSRACAARVSAGILEPRKPSLFMDSVLATASRVSLSRFLLGWLLSWILPAMPDLPAVLAALGVSGVLFGLVLGALQTPALEMSGRLRIQWTASSAVAGLVPASWAYLALELRVLDHLRDALAAVIPLSGRWRYLPGAEIWVSSIVFGFALPTGLLMHWLLRRHQRADAAALVRRFEYSAPKKTLAIRCRCTMSG
jgi:hypothetical protein